jgi:aromatic-L-amino-acid decarboxylase
MPRMPDREALRDSTPPLEPDADTLRRLTEEAVRFALDHVAALDDAPASSDDGVAELVASLMNEPVPEQGRTFAAVLDLLDPAVRAGFNNPGPGFFAFIPGGGIPAAALADLVAGMADRFVTVDRAAPGLAAIERVSLQWLAQLLGMPHGSGGVYTSGGSISSLAALVTARDERLGEDFAGGTLYASVDTHACIAKAARVAGFPARALRLVAVDARRRLVPAALAAAIDADRAQGLRPFFVVANAGTTNTGAVDPLPEILEVARARGLWTHVDGAYGGFFRLADGGAALLPGLGDAESLTVDPHKGLFLPYGTGVLLVRDPEALRRAHRSEAAYLQDVEGESVLGSAEYGPELSRDFRGLRVWLPFLLHGVAAFRAQLTEKLALTRHAWQRLKDEPWCAMFDEPQLSVVAFTVRPPKGHALDANAFGAELLRRVNARRRVFLSSTTIEGRYVVRLCVLGFRTHLGRVDEAVDALIEEANAIASAPAPI